MDLAVISEQLRGYYRQTPIEAREFTEHLELGKNPQEVSRVVRGVVIIDHLTAEDLDLSGIEFLDNVEIRDVTVTRVNLSNATFRKNLTFDGLNTSFITPPYVVDGKIIVKSGRFGSGLTLEMMPPIST